MEKKHIINVVVESFVEENPIASYMRDSLNNSLSGGLYNGYAVVHISHPDYGKDYDDVDVRVHGGLTFSRIANSTGFKNLKEEYCTEDYWVFGFDTLHSGDTRAFWTKKKTEMEARDLASQLYMRQIKKMRDDNRNISGKDV